MRRLIRSRRLRRASLFLRRARVDAVEHLSAGLGVQAPRLVEAHLGIGAKAEFRLLAAEAVAIGPEAVIGVGDAQEKAVAVAMASGGRGEPLQGAQGELGHGSPVVLRWSGKREVGSKFPRHEPYSA
jgi:hypothetical protein